MENIQKEIEKRAYGFFLERGGEHGHAMEDWIRAENEVRTGKITAAVGTSFHQQQKLIKTAFIMENKQNPNSIKKPALTIVKKPGKIHQEARV